MRREAVTEARLEVTVYDSKQEDKKIGG